MDSTWLSLDDFFTKEEKYRTGHMDREKFDKICRRCKFVSAAFYWVRPEWCDKLPDIKVIATKNGKPDLRNYFDHFCTFKNSNDEIFWAVSPYKHGKTKDEIITLFKDNGIAFQIFDGFYADYTIIIKPEDLVWAMNNEPVKSYNPILFKVNKR